MTDDDMAGGATFSSDGAYRYTIWRRWSASGSLITFVCLNPSIADAERPDPTLTRCVGFAKREGAGSVAIVNLFALVTTDPKGLYSADPVGLENDETLRQAAVLSTKVVFAWGVHGGLHRRNEFVIDLFRDHPAWCFGRTKAGHPRHPLYLAGDTPLVPWSMSA